MCDIYPLPTSIHQEKVKPINVMKINALAGQSVDTDTIYYYEFLNGDSSEKKTYVHYLVSFGLFSDKNTSFCVISEVYKGGSDYYPSDFIESAFEMVSFADWFLLTSTGNAT